ncbi:MAG: FG-GAP-like repeat-containing protein [Gemmatimonadales bacterium]
MRSWVLRSTLVVAAGVAMAAMGCRSDAGDSASRATEIITLRTLGLAYLEENRLEEAEQQFGRLIELAPKEPLGYANLGLVDLRLGKYEDAEKALVEARKLAPDDADIRLLMAKVYDLTDRTNAAVRELDQAVASDSSNVKVMYALADLLQRSGGDGMRRSVEYLSRTVELAPANIAARLQLIEGLVRNQEMDAAIAQMEEVRRQVPELPKEAVDFFERSLAALREGRSPEALQATVVVHNFLKVTPIYQAGLRDLKGPGGADVGFPIITFSRNVSAGVGDRSAVLAALRFTDASAVAGLAVVPAGDTSRPATNVRGGQLSVADYDGDGDQDLFVSNWKPDGSESVAYLFRNDLGKFVDVTSEAGIDATGTVTGSAFGDYDNDGLLDLLVIQQGPNVLYHNAGNGRFENVSRSAGVGGAATSHRALFADLDQEGDLDVFVGGRGPNEVYRNNLDGTFVDQAQRMGLAGSNRIARDAVMGDFDEDGDLDLFVTNQSGGNSLFSNQRQGRFRDVTSESGLGAVDGGGAAAAGDYNNDGFLDLFVTSLTGDSYHLYRNNRDGTFSEDERSSRSFRALTRMRGLDAEFVDFDNDGFLDLVVVGEPIESGAKGVFLLHNDGSGKYEDRSSLLPGHLQSGRMIAIADYNEDGDMDLFIVGLDGRPRLIRNDGGDANHYIKLQLVGLRTGNGKNNHFGIGAKLEVRAGDLYQMRVVTEPTTHLGLGEHLKADVVRIVWTNGVPQNLFFPGSDQDLVEQQTLKGSCGFLYVWDGVKYDFVTDVLWQSALGMPLGIMGGATAYAPSGAAHEYIKIPSGLLKQKSGIYSLRLTEELWEAAYVDKVNLVVLDHPDSVDLFVDERFVPPPASELRLYQVGRRYSPQAAFDDRSNDLLATVRAKDDRYVANLIPGPYQGITRMHDLVLDLGSPASSGDVVLYLNGWVFPTDASINVSMSQAKLKVVPPYLQVINSEGDWQTVIPDMSFPSGKNKMVVVDLRGRFLTGDRRVRIRTNMEVYWDYIFFTIGIPNAELRRTTLSASSAAIRYRGFSRLFRKGGRYGPHWFDYDDVTRAQQWRDLEGNYTRYGDVLPLMVEEDDKYAIVNSGDEILFEFDAEDAPALETGWTRDFLVYSVGWIKDGDLNTAEGRTVEPLPFHGMSTYPYRLDEAYPRDREHLDYLEKYNTRKVGPRKF